MSKHSKGTIAFTQVRLPFGWLGSMAHFPIEYSGKTWKTAEHLFQALRFDDEAIKEQIRTEPSPMWAKILAKRNAAKMAIVQRGGQDVANMGMVLRLKLQQHPELRQKLLDTANLTIVEDCSKRKGGSGLFWGAAWENGQWAGENMLGRLWMTLRDELTGRDHGFSIDDVRTIKNLANRIGTNAMQRLVGILTAP
jgi:ribA/ribD-fused uncharacterized protein